MAPVPVGRYTGGTHKGAGWRTVAVVHITVRGLGSIRDSTVTVCSRRQEPEDYALAHMMIHDGRKPFLSPARVVFHLREKGLRR